ncbi:MAG: MraY family glycosyltransferase [Verrucomicrobiota bacterium]|jgi:UDP-GlcNAc:undecaprenyl-phosphate GlcNAc-1-phosphate transferase
MFGQLLICGLLGFGISFGVILLTLRLQRHCKPTGSRDEFHHAKQASVSRLGGIGLAAGFVSVFILSLTVLGCPLTLGSTGIIGAALAMFGLGLWDDLRALGARRKFYGQLIIATVAYFLGISINHFKIPLTDHIIDLGFWSWPVTVFWLVAMTNLINLIDGVDGLAGGISLMLMLLMSVMGGTTGCVSFVAAGMTGALAAFLRFNFPPAKIYMGDGGAYFLGCLIGLLTITSSHKGTVVAALIAPLFVLALPILDTSLAIVRRGLRGLPLFRADRRHIHHRLMESGLSQRNVVLGLYAFTAFFLGLGFIAFWWRGQYLPLVLGGGALAVLLAAGRFNFSSEWFAVGRVLGSSLHGRAEIQYALAQTRWLAMEGARGQTIGGLCEDTVFVARKLGYDSVRIRLDDGDRTWHITPLNGNELCLYRRKVPGHRDCFIELGVSRLRDDGETSPASAGTFVVKDFNIMSDLLAEGWAKAIAAWERQNQLPVHFEGRKTPVPEEKPKEISKTHPATI